MAFWTTLGTDTKDPKRNFRFIVNIAGIGGTESTLWYAKKVDKPNFSVSEAKHSFLNHTFYWPGRVEWQKVTMTMVDPVEPDVAGAVATLIKNAGYKPPASTADSELATMSKAKFAKAFSADNASVGEISIIQLNAEGDTTSPVEKWILKNAFVTNVKYGSLDYENDDLTEIELELRYDWAEVTTVKVDKGFSPSP